VLHFQLNAGAQARGAKAAGISIRRHREARQFHAPAGVRGAVGEALKLRAARGAALVLGMAAHGTVAKASRKRRCGRKAVFFSFASAAFAAFA